MSDNSAIEWTDATWNPTVGCTKVSAGCDHCYAETLVNRFAGSNKGFPNRFDVMTLRGEDHLTLPLRWRKPKRVFVNSLSDLFHDDVPDEFIAQVFAVMAVAQQHTFQLLTKRHGRMRSLLNSEDFRLLVCEVARTDFDLNRDSIDRVDRVVLAWPLRNVWLGVSVESQQWADIRIPALLDTPAAVRFLSCEPLLGPIDLRQATRTSGESQRLDDSQISWVIAGGESGPSSRPAHPDWFRSLRDDCTTFDIPFFFKQWGEWAPTGHLGLGSTGDRRDQCVPTTLNPKALPREGEWLRRVGKKVAGRELDGRTWDEFPAVPA